MTANPPKVLRKTIDLPPYETVALVLQGGGALGAYQAGVFAGLHEAGIEPNWLAGISIGALNTAIIAGNAPEKRVEQLDAFWRTICEPALFPSLPAPFEATILNGPEPGRVLYSAWQAWRAVSEGQRGFFTPRFPLTLPIVMGSDPGHASYYDTSALRTTLERFVDFDRINAREMRVSVGAVDVHTGNFVYFDNTRDTLRAEHFMASGALPPGFPAIEIDGNYYWDGGLVSNTPLSEVLGTSPRRDTLAFQVDLWSARGPLPDNLNDVAGRQKDIQYSSRTRFVTDNLQRAQHYRRVLRGVLDQVPPEIRKQNAWCHSAEQIACSKRYNVIQMIYRNKEYEGQYKDYQFGLSTILDHWRSGYDDLCRTLSHPEWLAFPTDESGFVTHDIHRHETV